MSAPEHLPGIDNGVLRFLTCGNVDDGKSTLIGRLLYDTRAILADTLNAIETSSQRRGLNAVDLSLLTDGLQAEREQGITIDVAYRYFSSGTRKYIIADAPGHEQYTRNMVTAASTAHLAIILVDARRGVRTQTRRHTLIAHLLGIRQIVVAVNKMDLVGHDEAVFERIRADYLAFAQGIGMRQVRFVPMSARNGDMVVERGANLDWYAGPTLLELLEQASAVPEAGRGAFRFPVQLVCRPRESGDAELHDYRGFMGRIESGDIAVGEQVMVLPSGQTSTVSAIEIGGIPCQQAIREASVTLRLSDEIDISRGDMIVRPDTAPAASRHLEATLCWLSETPLSATRSYMLRHTTREVRARLAGTALRVDLDSLQHQQSTSLAMNDIAQVSLKLAQPVFADAYEHQRATGAFILIDESSNNTVAAGLIRQAMPARD